MTISVRLVDTMCNDDATTSKRWAPFFWRLRRHVSRLMGVGDNGGQGGAPGS